MIAGRHAKFIWLVGTGLFCLCSCFSEIQAQEKAGSKLTPEALKNWAQGDYVFIALLNDAQGGPVGLSEPPLYTHRLQLVVEKALRGTMKQGQQVMAAHSIRQQNEPIFPVGKKCIVSAKLARGYLQAIAVKEATEEELNLAKLACSVPIGWTMKEGKLVSPWAALGTKGWNAKTDLKSPFVCAKTGRPALTVGEKVDLTVEKVPPKVKLKYGNPDGDGEYKITLTNVGEKPVTVPALLTDGKNILWDESLVIVCQNKVYPTPGAKGVTGKVLPTTLKPGESVSTVVNALKLQGPEWPRGGYRIEFQFCLGEKGVTESFYYLSKHHDPIREKLQEK